MSHGCDLKHLVYFHDQITWHLVVFLATHMAHNGGAWHCDVFRGDMLIIIYGGKRGSPDDNESEVPLFGHYKR